MTQCGRPTKTGSNCRRDRLGIPGGWRIRALFGQPIPDIEMPPSCWQHLTEEEAAFAEALYLKDREERALEALADRKPPTCWSWPVTDAHLERARLIRKCADLGDAYVAATRLIREWQQGRCAVCGGARCDEVLDHDHATGLIRGRLCQSCNLLEGFASDPEDPCVLYRTRNPATMLGVRMLYYSRFTGWAEPEPEREINLDRSPGYLLATYLADGPGD